MKQIYNSETVFNINSETTIFNTKISFDAIVIIKYLPQLKNMFRYSLIVVECLKYDLVFYF